MVTILEPKNTKFGSVTYSMILCVLHDSHCECGFISLSCSPIIQMDLSHALRSNWHHNLTKEVSVIIRRQDASLNPVCNESIIEFSMPCLCKVHQI